VEPYAAEGGKARKRHVLGTASSEQHKAVTIETEALMSPVLDQLLLCHLVAREALHVPP